jgi:hypothetical protein
LFLAKNFGLWYTTAVEAVEANEVAEASEVNEALKVSKA